MLGDGNLRAVKGLPFGEVRERAAVPVRRLFLQEGTENAVDLPPAFGEDAPALCGEGMAAAVKGGRDRLIYGSADAHSSLQQTRRNKLRSPRGRALISAFSISIVGIMAWWSDTSLSEIMASTSGKKFVQPSKGGNFAARWITQETVSAMSEVRYRLSVRG